MSDPNRVFQVQHLLLRVYVGVDFVHHFAEKAGLLGRGAYRQVSDYFAHTVPDHAGAALVLAALCEFAAFVGFTFGLFTRVAALGTAAYLLIASIMGGHFANGFTWANPGGGWEYPLLWTILCASFTITGGGAVSVDARLRNSRSGFLRTLST